ncbi:MAG: PmoA family protein, partial [Clostridiales bacterium]|nr:PmoA family protein [Clostridiales bacterium]
DKLFGSYVTYGFDKPFFGPVTDAEGNVFTRVDPDTREHPHQRSVFIGVGDVNGVDCWNETPGHGCVRNQVIRDLKQEAAYASFTVGNIWTDADGKPLVYETSTYTVYNQSDACRALDVEVTFRANHGDVTFGPTKEAGPLGIRLRDELRADIGAGQLTNSWGGVGEGECWSHAAAWCDYYGEPAGIGPMGVTVFDNEKNERFPTAWHIRAYGLFAANNLYFKGGLTIKNGESLTYRFRILFRRCPMSREEISDRFVHYTLRPID